ncbi:2-dehydro-3-deoxy-6-phosphogalactonate aldolase [Andreprevotia sp. IGB-42]|uniref:2-dehydro-3-deoxy-6-phosphogalactonate aldolase n=1 Tax=Andreprevotia sp. IGB-42 TaxID=2497473 RepID=UPI001356C941|nr:2-dehydro-3-deoxy-6-phosphogalactonate aldolase [Andreprevotia sp. IGB-42]KAF0814483.1 2-dehydro-3-deoxy-6-phosphogalactonate aldolase [Andreprevotia sp. IGB-42]
MPWPTRLPLIAILRGITPDEVLDHVGVLIEEGFDAIEVPLNSPDWQRSIALTVQTYGLKALIGAGTVLEPAEVELLAALGSKLVVTPNTNEEVIRSAVALSQTTCIGCMTPSEVFTAIKAGAQALKIFPGGLLGPAYIKALLAVIPKHVPVFVVGGITPANLHEYLAVGCAGAGLGSDLYKPGQFLETTRERAQAFVAAYRRYQEQVQ